MCIRSSKLSRLEIYSKNLAGPKKIDFISLSGPKLNSSGSDENPIKSLSDPYQDLIVKINLAKTC